MLVGPIVTDADRDWALRQCPAWCVRSAADVAGGEIVDDDGWLDSERASPDRNDDAPSWDLFVIEQIENFERYFAHERKTYGDWSGLWRYGWWPKANPEKRFPDMAPKVTYPYCKKGSPEFARAMSLGTEKEKWLWDRIGVAQFALDDRRLDRIFGTKAKPADVSLTKRITGDRE